MYMNCKSIYLQIKRDRIRTVTLSCRKKYISKNKVNNLLSFTIRFLFTAVWHGGKHFPISL